ncbi:hypothetical protein F4604DRAFT_1679528 [Suillus subluteus]|nr:hypothetical protein F4604DRAFT_1679528 [Suillus subluteus]
MSSSTQDLVPKLHFEITFGALFVGVTVVAVLNYLLTKLSASPSPIVPTPNEFYGTPFWSKRYPNFQTHKDTDYHLVTIFANISALFSGVAIDLLGIEWVTFMVWGTIASVDIVIALSLCYLLATTALDFLAYVQWKL